MLRHPMARDGAGMFLAQIGTIGIGMISGIIMARCFSLADMGRYQLIMSYVAVGRIAALPGMNIILNKGALKGYDRICAPAIFRSVLVSSLTGLVLLSGGGLAFWHSPQAKLGLTLLVVGAFQLLSGFEKFDSILQGKKEFILSRQIVLGSAVFSLMTVGSAAYFTRRLSYVIAASFGVRVFTLAVGWGLTLPKLQKSERDPLFEQDLLRQGWRQTALSVFNLLLRQVDRLILGTIDPALLAVYHIGSVFPNQIKNNAKSLLVVPVNYWGSMSKHSNLRRIRQHGLTILGSGLGLTLAIWLLAPWVLPLLYGPNYQAAVPIARWLSLPIGLNFLALMVFSLDLYQNQGRFYTLARVVRQSVYVILLVALAPLPGWTPQIGLRRGIELLLASPA